jgi:hypothetical protein
MKKDFLLATTILPRPRKRRWPMSMEVLLLLPLLKAHSMKLARGVLQQQQLKKFTQRGQESVQLKPLRG